MMPNKILFTLVFLFFAHQLSAQSPVEEKVINDSYKAIGVAYNVKGGAAIAVDSTLIWVEGMDYWPQSWHGEKILAQGTLVIRNDNPVVALPEEGEIAVQGIPVPADELDQHQWRHWLISPNCSLLKAEK